MKKSILIGVVCVSLIFGSIHRFVYIPVRDALRRYDQRIINRTTDMLNRQESIKAIHDVMGNQNLTPDEREKLKDVLEHLGEPRADRDYSIDHGRFNNTSGDGFMGMKLPKWG